MDTDAVDKALGRLEEEQPELAEIVVDAIVTMRYELRAALATIQEQRRRMERVLQWLEADYKAEPDIGGARALGTAKGLFTDMVEVQNG